MVSLIVEGKRIYDKFTKDEVTVYAAQASFFIVLSFFPFIIDVYKRQEDAKHRI